MLLLLTFVAFGTSIIWSGLTVLDGPTLLFAFVALVARTVVLYPMLGGRAVSVGPRDRRLIALFGPRGLSSLLFTLLPVFAGIPGAERLFAIACLVVLLSVVVHGVGIALFLRANQPRAARAPEPAVPGGATGTEGSYRAPEVTHAEPMTTTGMWTPGDAVEAALVDGADGRDSEGGGVPERITLQEVRTLSERGESVVIVDSRADRSYRADGLIAKGAVRLPPDDPVRDAERLRLSQHATLVVYCA
jgi:hypothetical protein